MAKEMRTYADRREYFIAAVNKRRRKIKIMAIEHKGGRCQLCGYKKHQAALEFHHIVPALKSFGIASEGHSRSWARVKEELAKCVLVCANCHREISAGLVSVDHLLTTDN